MRVGVQVYALTFLEYAPGMLCDYSAAQRGTIIEKDNRLQC